jgi:catechol 2,3-dioxygenase-like lactoylglutathione lyase family enzyme
MSSCGIDHLGLTVSDLEASASFFTQLLGWKESGRDPSYPRCAVSDGTCRLTLWQVDRSLDVNPFDRRRNIGLHHLAIKLDSVESLTATYEKLKSNGITIEFSPEFLGDGPRKHFMCTEPGGLRIEFIWNGILTK